MNIKDEIVIITGGASGLGYACAEYLKDQGANVVILDRKISDKNGYYEILVDVCDESSVEDAFKDIISKLGIPRICINCAGIAPAAKIVSKKGVMNLNEFKHVINVNLIGTFNVLKASAANMMQLDPLNTQERGVIINTASIAAYEGQIGQCGYSASKGGVVSLTLPAARELAKFGIRVNTIAPGVFATPMVLNMPEELQESLKEKIPFPKRFGEPQEYASLVEHIIKNPMINGEVIRIDAALRLQ